MLLFLSEVSLAGLSDSTDIYIKPIFSLPLTLDPVLMNDNASQVVANQIYDGLIRVSEKLILEPSIAKTWSTSKDGLTLTFQLHEGARFHDGNPVTASDVVFSLTRAMNSPVVGKLYDCIVRDQANQPRIKALGPKAVTIELKKPFPPILSVLSGVTAKILPRKKVEQNPGFFNAPIGSGPFRYVSRDEIAREVTLESFARYHDGVPKITRMILKEASLPASVALATQDDAHEIVNSHLPAHHAVFRKGRRISSPVVTTWMIGLNTRVQPFNKIEVRRTLKQALETDQFRKKFFPDAVQAFGYIPPGLPGYLKEPLFKPKSVPRTKAMESLPEIPIAIPDSLDSVNEMVSHLEDAARSAGIKINGKLTEWDQLIADYSAHKSAAFLVSMGVDYPDVEFLLQNFESTNLDSFSGVKDAELDRLIRASRLAQDRVTREQLHLKAVKHLESLAVTINLFHPRQNLWVHECVQGLKPHLMGDVYLDYRGVHIDQGCMNLKVARR